MRHIQLPLWPVVAAVVLLLPGALAAQDTTKAAPRARAGAAQARPQFVVCIDGSTAPSGPTACRNHGGVDSLATRAAMKARFHGQAATGKPPLPDSTESDTVRVRPPGRDST